jgi:hypothetical protein
VKAGTIVADLNEKFSLGHGYEMAIVGLPRGQQAEGNMPKACRRVRPLNGNSCSTMSFIVSRKAIAGRSPTCRN